MVLPVAFRYCDGTACRLLAALRAKALRLMEQYSSDVVGEDATAHVQKISSADLEAALLGNNNNRFCGRASERVH